MDQLSKITNAKEFVSKILSDKQVFYGFGHKVYKDKDPRAKQLIELCDKVGLKSKYLDLVSEIEKEIEVQKGKKIVLNIDGAILLEMGFSPRHGKAVFVIGRTPGLAAQVVEELENEEPVRRVDEKDIQYHGK